MSEMLPTAHLPAWKNKASFTVTKTTTKTQNRKTTCTSSSAFEDLVEVGSEALTRIGVGLVALALGLGLVAFVGFVRSGFVTSRAGLVRGGLVRLVGFVGGCVVRAGLVRARVVRLVRMVRVVRFVRVVRWTALV